jgi:hypothetical protein
LPVQDLLAPGRAVALLLYLLHESPHLLPVGIVVLRKQTYMLIVTHAVTPDHRKGETAIVADVSTLIQGIEQVASHRTLAQVFYRHK